MAHLARAGLGAVVGDQGGHPDGLPALWRGGDQVRAAGDGSVEISPRESVVKRHQTCTVCAIRWAQKKGLCARCYRTRYPGPLPVTFRVETVKFTRRRRVETPPSESAPTLYTQTIHGVDYEVMYAGKQQPSSSPLLGSQLAGESANHLERMRF